MKLHRLGFGTLLLVAVLALGTAVAGSLEPSKHRVKMGKKKDCIACHEKRTPEVFKEWFASDHGMFNVKCAVCHGSVGDDFTMEPTIDRCIGCHADHVASMDLPVMKGKTCFTCHTAHALSPHGM